MTVGNMTQNKTFLKSRAAGHTGLLLFGSTSSRTGNTELINMQIVKDNLSYTLFSVITTSVSK